ncbi:hypothetical protein FRC11_014508, partial [Ceratobasidium sp. 423]
MISLNPHPSVVKVVPTTLTSRTGSAVFTSKASTAKYDDRLNEIPASNPPEPVIHHPEFFFDNTLIAVQLAKSEFFSEIFKLPKPEDGEPEAGSSPEHPIVIQGATASDFAALLRVLYASNLPAPEAPLIIPAFRLSNLLSFSDLRAFLLPLAEKNLDDVDKIVFAREFDIKEWLAPAHMRLCKREALLSTEEARKLGVDSVLLISRMREQYRNRSSTTIPNDYYCYSCA